MLRDCFDMHLCVARLFVLVSVPCCMAHICLLRFSCVCYMCLCVLLKHCMLRTACSCMFKLLVCVDYTGCLYSSFVFAHLVDFNVLLQPGGVHGADCEQLHQVPAEEPVGRVDGIQEPGLGEQSSKGCCRFLLQAE